MEFLSKLESTAVIISKRRVQNDQMQVQLGNGKEDSIFLHRRG